MSDRWAMLATEARTKRRAYASAWLKIPSLGGGATGAQPDDGPTVATGDRRRFDTDAPLSDVAEQA